MKNPFDIPSGYKIAFLKVRDFDGNELEPTALPATINNPSIEIGLIPQNSEVDVLNWSDDKLVRLPPGARIIRLKGGDLLPLLYYQPPRDLNLARDVSSRGEYLSTEELKKLISGDLHQG